MHTSQTLTRDTFTIAIDGSPATVGDLLPGFDRHDRIGVVVGRPHGLVGASLLVLAGVFAFYELQRERGGDFCIYPDFYAFHVGRPQGHHGALDLWPPHKEVLVAPDGTELLRAINDRGITRLLVEDGGADPGPVEAGAVASATARLRTAFAYGPQGRADRADVEISGDAATERYVDDVLHPARVLAGRPDGPASDVVRARFDEVPQTVRDGIAAGRETLRRDGGATEGYRRIGVPEALGGLMPRA